MTGEKEDEAYTLYYGKIDSQWKNQLYNSGNSKDSFKNVEVGKGEGGRFEGGKTGAQGLTMLIWQKIQTNIVKTIILSPKINKFLKSCSLPFLFFAFWN